MGSLDLQQLRRFDGACILSVRGQLDESTVRIFAQGLDLNFARSRRLVVDLTDCNVSSDGLTALLDFHRRTSVRTRVALVASAPCLLTMLHAVGLTSKFETYSNVGPALAPPAEPAPPARPTSFRRRRRLALLQPAAERKPAGASSHRFRTTN